MVLGFGSGILLRLSRLDEALRSSYMTREAVVIAGRFSKPPEVAQSRE